MVLDGLAGLEAVLGAAIRTHGASGIGDVEENARVAQGDVLFEIDP